MEKRDIKNILISMRTTENEVQINNLLGKIDMLDFSTLQEMLQKIGDNEDSVRKFLESKLYASRENTEEKYPINSMFTYGISGNCVHLHLPMDLHQMISQHGISATIANVHLQLIDAIEKIGKLKADSFYRFNNVDSIYMISPILVKREINFLNDLGFTTNIHSKKKLKDSKYLEEVPEAQLATHIFGNDKNVGSALIKIDTILGEQWKQLAKKKVEELENKIKGKDKSEKTLE